MLFKCKDLSKILSLRWQQKIIHKKNSSSSLEPLHKQLNSISSATTTFETNFIRNLSFFGISKFVSRFFNKMDDPKKHGVFSGEGDRFNGIIVDSAQEFEQNVNFEEKLQKSIDYWIKHKRRTIWFKVRSKHAEWVPDLVKHQFEFHHAREGYVSLRRWLPKDEQINLPDYAHTMVGVGGLVINPAKMEVLVVTDRFAAIPGSWKLPGGYVDPKENIVDAVLREVKEETGIEGVFRTMVAVRHSHGGGFGCSDLYFVVGLFAKTFEIVACQREIARARWMSIAEYLKHPSIHETNRHFMKTYLDYERRGLCLDFISATHQILKKEYQVFYTRAIDDCEKIKVPTEEDLKMFKFDDSQREN